METWGGNIRIRPRIGGHVIRDKSIKLARLGGARLQMRLPELRQKPISIESMNLRAFAAELRRRNVYKIAASYAVVAWLVIQVATQVLPFFELPNWVVRLVVLLVVLGFPIALMVAWVFELTLAGIQRADTIDPGQSYRSGSLWIYVVLASLLASGGLFLAGRYVGI